MAVEPKQGPQWATYNVIRMRSNEEVDIPGVRPKVVLFNVKARQTAFGMDVLCEGAGYDSAISKAARETKNGSDLVISIPAYKIAQAERVIEGS